MGLAENKAGGGAKTPQRKDTHDHTPEEERTIREAALDETIEDTFPASDPPSSLPNPHDHAALERRKSGKQ